MVKTVVITPQDDPEREKPDLTLREETLDFFYRICGYTPIPEISQALSSPTFGFLSKEYTVRD